MRLFLSLIITLFVSQLVAQTLAVTEVGDTIYVYDDGTWSFEEKTFESTLSDYSYLDIELDISTSNKVYKYSQNDLAEVNSKFGFYDLKYNTEYWERIPPATINLDAEFAFKAKEKDIWCMSIAEETEVGIENALKAALYNAEQSSEGAPELLLAEYRTVNGQQLLRGVIRTTITGIDVTFDSYYYSGDVGTLQYTTYCSSNIHERYEDEIVKLLNGLILNP